MAAASETTSAIATVWRRIASWPDSMRTLSRRLSMSVRRRAAHSSTARMAFFWGGVSSPSSPSDSMRRWDVIPGAKSSRTSPPSGVTVAMIGAWKSVRRLPNESAAV